MLSIREALASVPQITKIKKTRIAGSREMAQQLRAHSLSALAKGLGFNSKNPLGCSPPFVTPVPEDATTLLTFSSTRLARGAETRMQAKHLHTLERKKEGNKL